MYVRYINFYVYIERKINKEHCTVDLNICIQTKKQMDFEL